MYDKDYQKKEKNQKFRKIRKNLLKKSKYWFTNLLG